MTNLKEYNFEGVYEITNLIDTCVNAEEELWNYNVDFFIDAATKFSKESLLHLYIVTTSLNYYRTEFRKNGSYFEDYYFEKWYSLFESYRIELNKFDLDNNLEAIDWFDINFHKFVELFDALADEIFYILFANRQFLLKFNTLLIKTVKVTNFPANFLNTKARIKRTSIPKWVKSAVFHRDKGRCVFCNTDLTGIVNTLTILNYDHIVPLDLFGTNDPCNIQLTCESCNKSKKNKNGTTSNLYLPWWT